MIAAGTQATDGSTCRPDTNGPRPARTTRTRAMSTPSAVPMTIDAVNPMNACRMLPHRASWASPRANRSWICNHVSAGEGSAYGGFSSSR